jgi:GxxExxY protein
MLGTRHEVACSGAVVDAAIEVHRQLGPGLYEAVYVRCLAAELRLRGQDVEAEVAIPATYKGIDLDMAYRLDLVVGGRIVVEVKAVRLLTEVHHSQLLTYLRLTDRRIGVLLNFNTALMKQGIKRVYNTH